MTPSAILKDYEKNKALANTTNSTKNVFANIGTIVVSLMPLFMMYKYGVLNVSNNMSTVTSSGMTIGNLILQNIGYELKQINTSNYSEKFKNILDNQLINNFILSKREKTSVESQFDNEEYYKIDITEKFFKQIEKEKIRLKMNSIFNVVKDTIKNFNNASSNNSSIPKL